MSLITPTPSTIDKTASEVRRGQTIVTTTTHSFDYYVRKSYVWKVYSMVGTIFEILEQRGVEFDVSFIMLNTLVYQCDLKKTSAMRCSEESLAGKTWVPNCCNYKLIF